MNIILFNAFAFEYKITNHTIYSTHILLLLTLAHLSWPVKLLRPNRKTQFRRQNGTRTQREGRGYPTHPAIVQIYHNTRNPNGSLCLCVSFKKKRFDIVQLMQVKHYRNIIVAPTNNVYMKGILAFGDRKSIIWMPSGNLCWLHSNNTWSSRPLYTIYLLHQPCELNQIVMLTY